MGNLKKLIDLTLLRTYTNIVKGLIGTRASQSDLTTHTNDSTVHVTSAEKQTWNGKQDSLTFDEVPTANSSNPVKSGGVYSAIEDAKEAVRNAIQVTTSELRNLEIGEGLSSGTWYEITDYKPTISDATAIITIGGQSLHPTIISDPNTEPLHDLSLYVLALGVKTLSKDGFAVCKTPHYSMTPLKVRVDIRSSSNKRPSWADSSKPWVYWMQDANGNEAPFDFIHIGFTGTLDSTINTKGGITNGILPQTWNGWYAFNSTTVDVGSDVVAIDGSIGGVCKNCKITGYNIIFGKTDGITIEGDGNIVRNTDYSNSLKNVIVRGDNNKVHTDDYSDGSNSVVQGNSNIIVNSNVTMGKDNTQNIIKSSNTVIFGENNSYFEIDDANVVTIGNDNEYWNLSHSNMITIGDRNKGISSTPCYIIETLSEDTDEGVIMPSINITVGNDNVGIFLGGCQKCSIGSKNNNIWMSRYDKDGEIFRHITIGDYNESINLGVSDVSVYSTIGNHNKNIETNYGLAYTTIGNENKNFNFDERLSRSVIGSCNEDIEIGGSTVDYVTIGDNNKNIYLSDVGGIIIGNNNGYGSIETIDGIQYDNRNKLYITETGNVTIGNGNCRYPIQRHKENTWLRDGVSAEYDEFYAGIRIESWGYSITIGDGNEFLDLNCDNSEFSIGNSNTGIKLDHFNNVTIGHHNTYIKFPGNYHKIMIGNENKNIMIESPSYVGVQGLIIGSYCQNVTINVDWNDDAEYIGEDNMHVNYVIENHSRAIASKKIFCGDNYTGPSIHWYYENDWKIFHINNIQN